MANLSEADKQYLNADQQKEIAALKDKWAAANAAGDTNAMTEANKAAEAIRAQAAGGGYSGGSDGSGYVPTAGQPQQTGGQSGQGGYGNYGQGSGNFGGQKVYSTPEKPTRDRKNYKYVKCRNCGATLRLKRRKGTHTATCPCCKANVRVRSFF